MEFDWDVHNLRHIRAHKVTRDEAEQALTNDPIPIYEQEVSSELRSMYYSETNAARSQQLPQDVATAFAIGPAIPVDPVSASVPKATIPSTKPSRTRVRATPATLTGIVYRDPERAAIARHVC